MRTSISSPYRAWILVLGVAPLACCQATDPLTAQGRWQPIGANAANLAAAVEDPADLVRGRSDPGGDPVPAVAAVLRYRTGTVKPLPSSGLADIKLTTSDAPAPVAAAPTATVGGPDGG